MTRGAVLLSSHRVGLWDRGGGNRTVSSGEWLSEVGDKKAASRKKKQVEIVCYLFG